MTGRRAQAILRGEDPGFSREWNPKELSPDLIAAVKQYKEACDAAVAAGKPEPLPTEVKFWSRGDTPERNAAHRGREKNRSGQPVETPTTRGRSQSRNARWSGWQGGWSGWNQSSGSTAGDATGQPATSSNWWEARSPSRSRRQPSRGAECTWRPKNEDRRWQDWNDDNYG